MPVIHRVVYQPRNGMWDATWTDVADVGALGINLSQAERNIRVAIAAHLADGTRPEDLRLRHQYAVPEKTLELVLPSTAFKSGGADQTTQQRAAVELVRGLGITIRDAARILGVSHTRVVQLIRDHDTGDPNRNRVLFLCPACGNEFAHAVNLELSPSGSIRQLPTQACCQHCGHIDTYIGDRIRVMGGNET